MRKRKIKQISLGILISLIVSIPIFISSNTFASNLQTLDARAIFAASCATCHGADGKGGVTWIKDSPADKRIAPKLVGAGLEATYIKYRIRAGAPSAGMPAFGEKIINETELNALANYIETAHDPAVNPSRKIDPPPTPPGGGAEVKLYILDADPWYSNLTSVTTPFGSSTYNVALDPRRVALGAASDYLKIYNTGRTWHTFTTLGTADPDGPTNKDSSFIGYAGNYKDTPGDLGDMGYYIADQGEGLGNGCFRYFCRMHPYMQVEVCTAGNTPKGPTEAGATPAFTGGPAPWAGLTRAHKHPIATPTIAGVGEIWVTTQSQEEIGEDTTTITGLSVSGLDGTYQVINAATWGPIAPIPDPEGDSIINNIGNNPHNSWAGLDGDDNKVVLSASWHDNTVSLINADTKTLWAEKRSGGTNAHVMTTPTRVDNDGNQVINELAGEQSERFYITHMGGNVLQEIITENIPLGLEPNGQSIRGGTSPHGLWMCDNGNNVLTADTFAGSATIYNIGRGSAATTSSGGGSPLAPSIASGIDVDGSGPMEWGCSRGFTNNALSHDVSVYDITVGDPDAPDAISKTSAWANPVLPNELDQNGVGNIELRNTADQAATATTDLFDALGAGTGGLDESVTQARWVHLPIQTPVSPRDATAHGRYMVTANKASFNVSITALDSTTGLPTALYTIPAGLGAHGVTYGQKSVCDDSTSKCYYSYVTNTFEDYISVYDLEKLEDPDTDGYLGSDTGMGTAGSALVAESAYVEGGAIAALAALDPVVVSLCDVVDLTTTPDTGCDGTTTGDVATTGTLVYDLGGGADPGNDGDAANALDLNIGNANGTNVLACGIGALGGSGAIGERCAIGGYSYYAANVPIGVLCPNCRSGVHVGDVPLARTTGAALGGTYTSAPLGISDTGAASKYTYLKEEVYVDTESTGCVLDALSGFPSLGGGVHVEVNDCGAAVDAAGKLNVVVTLDLDLGINTGGQGIMTRDATTGSAPAVPWP